MKSLEILLQDILGDYATVYRTENADTLTAKAFYITFADYVKQNHRNKKGKLLDNMDYWMPIIRRKLPYLKIESFFHNSIMATLYISYDVKKHRRIKLKKIYDNKK